MNKKKTGELLKILKVLSLYTHMRQLVLSIVFKSCQQTRSLSADSDFAHMRSLDCKLHVISTGGVSLLSVSIDFHLFKRQLYGKGVPLYFNLWEEQNELTRNGGYAAKSPRYVQLAKFQLTKNLLQGNQWSDNIFFVYDNLH